jgi:uncharacterized iron-regulated membrane protein
MRLLALAHRWTGGLVGLVLALMGLSGAILVHKDAWVRLPHAADAQVRDVGALATALERLTSGPDKPRSIILASRDFGLHRLSFAGEAGAYADQSGAVVATWQSPWERPELWLFELHHHLFSGETGEAVAGVMGLLGLAFLVSGVVLWWPARRLFSPRLWPAALNRTQIVRHHRDLGVLVAPLLALSMLTGSMMALRPVADFAFAPWMGGKSLESVLAAPKLQGGPPAAPIPWRRVLGEARARFPDAEFRVVALPRKPGGLIAVRMRRAAEWLPNGRTQLWFDPADGRLVAARDALAAPAGAQAFNAVYPLHAAKVGGLPYRLLMSASGVVLALMGSFSVWSFWVRAGPTLRRSRRDRAPAT